jgi:hypothetical protein
MKPTRRTQPYRKGLATKMAGPAHSAMTRGAPAGLQNPQDVKRTLAKRMSKISIPPTNPLDYVDGQALGRHLRGGVKFPGQPKAPATPTTVIAGTPRPRRKRPGGKKPYER